MTELVIGVILSAMKTLPLSQPSADSRDYTKDPPEFLDPWRALCRFRMQAMGLKKVPCRKADAAVSWTPAEASPSHVQIGDLKRNRDAIVLGEADAKVMAG